MKRHSGHRSPALVAIITLAGCAAQDLAEPEQTALDMSEPPMASDSAELATGDLSEPGQSLEVCSLCCPLAPSAPQAAATGVDTLRLTWNDNSTTEIGFIVERSDNGGTWLTVGQQGADAESFVDHTYDGVVSFRYRVSAFNAVCTSDPSPLAIVPKSPINLVGTPIGDTGFQLTWTDRSNNEVKFVVQKKTATASWTNHVSVGANTTTVTVILVPGNNRYRVRADSANGKSWYSNEVSHSL